MRCNRHARTRATTKTMVNTMVSVALGLLLATPTLSAQTSAASDPYARYVRPGQCAQMASRLKDLYWRDKREDTVVYAPATDSVPAPALQAARACAARFSVANVPEGDLLGLIQLYLWTRQDDLAHSATDRLLKLQASQPALQRGWTLYLIMSSYLDARPARLTEARQYLAQLDALGAPAADWRMWAYTESARYEMSINDVQTSYADGAAALAASKQMAKNDRIDRAYEILDGYTAWGEPTALKSGGHAAVHLFDTAATDLLPLRAPGTAGSGESSSAADASGGMVLQGAGGQVVIMNPGGGGMTIMSGGAQGGGDANADQMQLRQAIRARQVAYTIVDTTGPTLNPSHWYNRGTDTTPRPKAGMVSLIVSVNAGCGARCYPTYSSLRRLYNKYHSAGLQIVLVSLTSGYFRNQPMANPADEAEKVRYYYLDFLKLPDVMGVDETEFSFRAEDHKRMNVAPSAQRAYFRGRNSAVVGKDGKVKMVANLAPNREDAVSAVIARELAK